MVSAPGDPVSIHAPAWGATSAILDVRPLGDNKGERGEDDAVRRARDNAGAAGGGGEGGDGGE